MSLARSGRSACALAVAAVVVLGGCTSSATVSGAGTVASSSRPAPSTTAPATITQQLEAIALHRQDLPMGSTVSLAPGGGTVVDEVTLDNCNYAFTSEDLRVARRQYNIIDAAARGDRVGNEVVAYDTTQSARLAFEQWHRAAQTCPRGYSHSTVQGEPPLREHVLRDRTGVPGLPATLTIVTGESARPRRGHELWLVTALQVQGRILDAVYLATPAAPSAADYRLATSLARKTGARLVRK